MSFINSIIKRGDTGADIAETFGPDERKREAAKLARASQAKPFAESELSINTERESAFNMIAVHNSQMDKISKNVQEILGPYHRVLGGPTNGFHVSRNADFSRAGGGAEAALPNVGGSLGNAVPGAPTSSSTSGLQQLPSKSKHTNSSSVTVLPSNVSNSSAGDSKKQPVLQDSLNVSSQSIKITNPLIPTCESNNVTVSTSSSSSFPSNHTTVTSSSLQSPKLYSGNASNASQTQPEGKDCKNVLIEQKILFPLKQQSSSVTFPIKDITSKQQTFPNLSSKSVQSRSSLEPSRNLHENFTPIIPHSSGASSLSATSSRLLHDSKSDNLVNNSSNQLTISLKQSQTSEPTQPSLISAATSCASPPGRTKQNSLLSSQPHSTAPSLTKRLSPGEKPQHSTISAPIKSGGHVIDKAKLTLKMQSEKKIPTSKSDLNEIFKELADLHDPVTAIETPCKLENRFPFSASNTSGKVSQLELLRNKSTEVSQKLTETKSDTEKEKHPGTVPGRGAASELVETKTLVESVPTFPEVSRGIVPGSGIGNKDTNYNNLGNSTYDVNSILRGDLNLSDDSDVDPVEEDNPVPSQPKTTKVISPAKGIPVKSAVSPMSSSSSSSSESSSEDSGDDDDEEEERKQRKSLSERRLSSSSSSSSSSSELSGDEDNCADDDGNNGIVKTNQDEIVTKVGSERVDKSAVPEGVTSAGMGSQSATVQNASSESSMVWCLKNFIQHPKKNSSSPLNGNPVEPPGSSPLIHFSAPPVPQKDCSSVTIPDHSNSPPGLTPCDTVPFVPQASEQSQCYDHSDERDIENNSKFLKRRNTKLEISSKKELEYSNSVSSLELSKQTKKDISTTVTLENNNKKDYSKSTLSKSDIVSLSKKFVDSFRKEFSRNSLTSSNFMNEMIKTDTAVTSENAEKARKMISPQKSKALRPRSYSSSNDEIDVESVTPDTKTHDRLRPSPKKTVSEDNRQEVCKQLFNSKAIEKSNEDSKSLNLKVQNSPIRDIKHHKRKSEPQSSATTSTPSLSASKLSSATKPSKKQHPHNNIDTIEDLEPIPKPATLSSAESTKKPSPIISSKALHPSHSSLAALPSQSSITKKQAPINVSDGNNHPQIIVQIQTSFLSKKLMKFLKDKKEKRKKHHKNSKLSENSTSTKTYSDTQNDTSALIVPGSKSSHKKNGSDKETHSLANVKIVSETLEPPPSSTAHSIQFSKTGKHKSNSNNANASPSSPQPKKAKSSSKETTPIVSSSLQSTSPTLKSLAHNSSEATPRPSVSSNSSKSKLVSLSLAVTKKTSNSVKSPDISIAGNDTKLDKLNVLKRKSVMDDETSKKARSKEPGSSTTVTTSNRVDSSSTKEINNSTSSKKSEHSSSASGTDVRKKHIETSDHTTINGSEKSSVPFHQYLNGNSNNTKNNLHNGTLPGSDVPPSLLADLPSPAPIETQLHNTKHYLARAREHKHHADGLRDKLAKYEPYLRSGLSFFLAGYSMEVSKREMSCSIYNDTSNLLQFVITMRVNSSSNPDFSDRERKLISLVIRLQAYLNHRLYRLRKTEANSLRKVLESEQIKLHLSSNTTATTNSSSSTNTTATNKPQVPSPHQNAWTKNSTRTPSPLSPTPSPAGSVSSQGSCELITGKIQNGTISSSSTPITSPSPSLVCVQQQTQTYSQRYFQLTSPMVKALNLWELAEAESSDFKGFFAMLDNACGPLSFHSEPPVIVRYMKHALRVLNLWKK